MTTRTRFALLLAIPLVGLVALCADRSGAMQALTRQQCHPSYPDFCIPPPPPDLDCADIEGKKPFRVRHDVRDPDPHRFDADKDGRACEPPRQRPRRG